MALIKQITAENGVIADYWRISQLNSNFQGGAGRIELLGYVSEQVRRDAGTEASCMQRSYPISPEDLDALYRQHLAHLAEIAQTAQALVGETLSQMDADDLAALAREANVYRLAYAHVKTATTPGVDPDTGERIQVPSEFADAQDQFDDLNQQQPSSP